MIEVQSSVLLSLVYCIVPGAAWCFYAGDRRDKGLNWKRRPPVTLVKKWGGKEEEEEGVDEEELGICSCCCKSDFICFIYEIDCPKDYCFVP